MKYLFRIISLPFYMALVLIAQIRLFFIHMYNWIVYGGEAVALRKGDRETLYGLFEELKKQNEAPH